MKESAWGYLIVMLGVIIIVILMFVQRLTTTNEEEYYLNRETLHSAMLDAVDYSALRGDDPKLIMIRDKFVEIFTRRFAESATPDKTYKLDFYQIVEEPPSATVRIRSYTGSTNVGRPNTTELNVAVDNTITAVLVMDDDGKVHARPPEMDEFVPQSGIYWALDLKRDKRYLRTKNFSRFVTALTCQSSCDVEPNAEYVYTKYNIFEFHKNWEVYGTENNTAGFYKGFNSVKIFYKDDINPVKINPPSDIVRYKYLDSVQRAFTGSVFIFQNPNADVAPDNKEIDYVAVNFSMKNRAGTQITNYEVVFKPMDNDQFIPVSEYITK